MPTQLFQPVHGHARRGFKSRTYFTWESMVARCHRPSAGGYEFYGGRGIRVCDRWRQFENFLSDMGERPARMSLERKDNNGNYEPDNCKWATREEQNANKRSSLMVAFQGRTQSLQTWCTELGLKWSTIYSRLQDGMSADEAFTKPTVSRLNWRPRWRPEEDAVIRAFYPGEGQRVVSRLPDRTADAIVTRAVALGVRRVFESVATALVES